MTELPKLSEYQESEWSHASALSPSIAHYRALLAKTANTLHSTRHTAWLQCAMATVFNKASTAVICRFWSHTADSLLKKSWTAAGFDGTSTALFALGKLGAEELNLSSDVDLLLVSSGEFAAQAEQQFKKFRAHYNQFSELGLLLRLDFDLRPGGNASPLWVTPDRFENHYWTQGEAWERLALVRLRPIVGAQGLIQSVMEAAGKFSYRKFLDYTLLEDLKLLRPKIHALTYEQDDGWDLKTGIGGIRDIELFAHALQVLHGGRIPSLHTRSTSEAYLRLSAEKLLAAKDAELLVQSYWQFRDLENKVQLVHDQQTHFLSASAAYPVLSDEEKARVGKLRSTINQLVSSVLGTSTPEEQQLLPIPDKQQEWLTQLGYSENTFLNVWPLLLNASAVSKKNERDERNRLQVIRLFVEAMAKDGLDPELGMSLLLDFIKSTRVKATFFTLLLREPRLIRDLARLFSISPYLGQVLASRPELIDSFIYKSQSPTSEQLDEALAQFSERRLLTEVLSALEFLQNKDLTKLQRTLSNTADEICKGLLERLIVDINAQHSPSILALGKWGGQEMGFRSDLDFIFVTSETPTESDFKLAKRMMSRLTEQQRGGSLYNVDLRLRPSGQSGPLIVHEQRLYEYFGKEASAWERQSYLRCRSLGHFAIQKLLSVIVERGLPEQDLVELLKIRQKLIASSLHAEHLDLKFSPGGLVEIEFAVQNSLLEKRQTPNSSSTLGHLEQLAGLDPQWKNSAQTLQSNYIFMRTLEQVFQLLASRSVAHVDYKSTLFRNCAKLMDCNDLELKRQIMQCFNDTVSHLKQLDPIYRHS